MLAAVTGPSSGCAHPASRPHACPATGRRWAPSRRAAPRSQRQGRRPGHGGGGGERGAERASGGHGMGGKGGAERQEGAQLSPTLKAAATRTCSAESTSAPARTFESSCETLVQPAMTQATPGCARSHDSRDACPFTSAPPSSNPPARGATRLLGRRGARPTPWRGRAASRACGRAAPRGLQRQQQGRAVWSSRRDSRDAPLTFPPIVSPASPWRDLGRVPRKWRERARYSGTWARG